MSLERLHKKAMELNTLLAQLKTGPDPSMLRSITEAIEAALVIEAGFTQFNAYPTANLHVTALRDKEHPDNGKSYVYPSGYIGRSYSFFERRDDLAVVEQRAEAPDILALGEIITNNEGDLSGMDFYIIHAAHEIIGHLKGEPGKPLGAPWYELLEKRTVRGKDLSERLSHAILLGN